MIKVLIVEDDLGVARINQRFVEKIGGLQVVGIATDEEQSKEQLEIFEPDLVLLDLYFPDMHGLQLLQHIRLRHRHTDVIIITAAKELDTVREAIRGGVFDYIIKPVIFNTFAEKMKNYILFRKNIEQGNRQVDQEQVDLLLLRRPQEKIPISDLPKGIDKLTLEKITLYLEQSNAAFTVEDICVRIGSSRTTARRYLEYLVSVGKLKADVSYGTVGRPERIYRTVN
ncbi:response regulator [Ferviditalea candida]|uniref:Transcriptional regulatory protein n=1 Tax=Ferviditalea candida TaxID=3108399 RepID=A0ABU5ZMM9_9BACL|nr:response regulator [Paenibacillaceae bacterium T2]